MKLKMDCFDQGYHLKQVQLFHLLMPILMELNRVYRLALVQVKGVVQISYQKNKNLKLTKYDELQ